MPIKKNVNQDFFKKWSSEMAYVLGFVFADGTITVKKNGSSYLALQIADEGLLKKIRRVIGSDHKISKRIHNRMNSEFYRLQIGNTEIVSSLAKMGVIPNKAARMELPIIPGEYFPDFVRGYFDGDGNVWSGEIHKNRRTRHVVLRLSFTSCSYPFLNQLRTNLRVFGVKGGAFYHSKSGQYTRLTFSTTDALTICYFMYNGRHKLFLQRKKKVFEEFVIFRSKVLRS